VHQKSDGLESRSEIDEVLQNLPIDEEGEPKKRKAKRKKDKKPGRTKKIVKRILLVLLLLIIVAAGYFVYRFIKFGNSVFEGGIISLIQKEKLKEDSSGRTNILVFGTEEVGHPGADLTDSIMVLSVNQTTKDAYMVSLPRDLRVGTCTSTGKLNETYWCSSQDDPNKEKDGAEALKAAASEILGLDIQYWVHVNWEVLRKSVDAVGGVDVTIESSDPRGIYDPNFDWACQYTCHYVDYKNGEVAHLDGEHALALARARNAQGGYGLPGGNFDREKNQQKILSALQKKALSVGTLANPAAVLQLMDSLGENLHTSFHTSEVRTLIGLASEVKNDDVVSVPLVDADNDIYYMKTANINGISVVIPSAGQGNYSEIHEYIKRTMTSDPVAREYAKVDVLNGSDTEGLGAAEAKKLENAGYNVVNIGNAPESASGKVVIYQLNKGMTGTASALKKRFGVELKTSPPANIASNSDFVIVFGKSTDR
jgi:LCP family protein required for cell wall assembly